MDKLVNRLRGEYQIGPDGIYGKREFSDFIPPISKEAADRIELLESAMQEFVDRCDKGEVRSKYTYNKFKEILAKSTT